MGKEQKIKLILDNIDYINFRIGKFGYVINKTDSISEIEIENLCQFEYITLDNIYEFIDAIISNY